MLHAAPDLRFPLVPHSKIPELTRSSDIQLNERVSLRRTVKAASVPAPDIAPHPDLAQRSRRAIIFRSAALLAEGPQSGCPILRERMAERSTDHRERYVEYATHCLQLAKIATDQGSRAILREMATEWLKLAEDYSGS
jgi:hypothetical protein